MRYLIFGLIIAAVLVSGCTGGSGNNDILQDMKDFKNSGYASCIKDAEKAWNSAWISVEDCVFAKLRQAGFQDSLHCLGEDSDVCNVKRKQFEADASKECGDLKDIVDIKKQNCTSLIK